MPSMRRASHWMAARVPCSAWSVPKSEWQREGPVETAEDTALLLQRAVAAHLVLAREHIDGLDAQGLRAARPAINPGAVRQSDLIADRRVAVRRPDGAVTVHAHGSDGGEGRPMAIELAGRSGEGAERKGKKR